MYDICTWKGTSECVGCTINGRLICHFKKRYLLYFIGLFSLFAIPAIIGTILAGYSWYLLGWFAFWIIFFEFWEIRILCSHCPYYAEKSRTIHCIANYGSFKAWKYHPEPINRSEKIQLIIGFIVFGGYPLIFLILGGQYFFLLLSLIGLIVFFSVLVARRCPKCVNFSCPLNRVPKKIVDAFLKRNPVMRKAWEDNGYQID